jgi:hypothetical protein
MYTVATFIKPKREDWDNGNEATVRADLDAFRYHASRSPMADIIREKYHLTGEGEEGR